MRAPEDGRPDIAAQVERAGLSASTDVVTIGVGGNSLPFGSLLVSCLVGGYGQPDDATPCRDAYENGVSIFDPEPIHDKYDRIVRKYAGMLDEVRKRVPNAKVITVGCPTLLPSDPAARDRTDTTEPAPRSTASTCSPSRTGMSPG